MALSEFALKSAKSREKPYRLADGDGLHLLVQPNGTKLWQLRYRFLEKENILSFGKYPAVTLADARRKRDSAKRLLADGTDPAEQRRQDKIAAVTAARTTFGLIAEEYIERMEKSGAAEATLAKKRWLLEDLANPLSNRPIKAITPAEILDFLRRIEKSGRRETARRLRGVIGSVFRLAIVTLRADADPTLSLRGALLAPKVRGHAAITDEKEFGSLLAAIDEYHGWPTLQLALKFLALTCVRPGEVRGALRTEFDLQRAVWRIPAGRTKMRHPHDVPLSRQALAVLEEAWPLSELSELVFPSIRSPKQLLSENAMNAAMRRMGYTKEDMTAHGFRSSFSSIMNERGYDPDVIEAALAHRDSNAIRRTYNRTTYWEQRVKLMQEWADLLDSFRNLGR